LQHRLEGAGRRSELLSSCGYGVIGVLLAATTEDAAELNRRCAQSDIMLTKSSFRDPRLSGFVWYKPACWEVNAAAKTIMKCQRTKLHEQNAVLV
jgi:hypothetical protein